MPSLSTVNFPEVVLIVLPVIVAPVIVDPALILPLNSPSVAYTVPEKLPAYYHRAGTFVRHS